MKILAQLLIGCLAATLLVACSGGGGGDANAGGNTPPPALNVTFDPISGPVTTTTIAAVALRVSTSTGAPVADGASVTLTVAPPDVAQVSTTATPPVLAASATATTTGGVARFLLHARAVGTATLTATASAPGSSNATATQGVPIVATPLPATVSFAAPAGPLYVQGSGGTTTLVVVANLFQVSGAAAGDPVVGINNVRIEITSGPGGGERLSGVNAAGTTVGGASINLRTTGGAVSFSLISGTLAGPISIRVTADRADNNVDNGLQDPVNATRSVAASDGRLFDLDIVNQNAVVVDGIGGTPVYRLPITAIATDRGGNPVLPGTRIDFGLIDGPFLFGSMLGRGSDDGNPQEGGTLFTTNFSRPFAAGGLTVGDTLVVFAEEFPGQRDMEAARVVQQFTSPNALMVALPFNRNDGSGAIVDAGGIFPFVVGRAIDGQLTPSAVTNARGEATATLSYLQAPLGRPIIVWAQGNGFATNGQPMIVADVERLTFSGSGPATLTAQPSSVFANRNNVIELCLRDSLQRGIPNAAISFVASVQAAGTQVTVDGRASPGVLQATTGADGCARATLASTGVSTQGGTVTFSAGGASTDVVIGAPGSVVLSVSPSAFNVRAGTFSLRATGMLVDGPDSFIVGALVDAICSSTGTTLSATGGLTDLTGRFSTVISGSGFVTDPDGESGPLPLRAESGTCIFRVVSNPAVTFTVSVRGTVGCTGIFPPPSGCPP